MSFDLVSFTDNQILNKNNTDTYESIVKITNIETIQPIQDFHENDVAIQTQNQQNNPDIITNEFEKHKMEFNVSSNIQLPQSYNFDHWLSDKSQKISSTVPSIFTSQISSNTSSINNISIGESNIMNPFNFNITPVNNIASNYTWANNIGDKSIKNISFQFNGNTISSYNNNQSTITQNNNNIATNNNIAIGTNTFANNIPYNYQYHSSSTQLYPQGLGLYQKQYQPSGFINTSYMPPFKSGIEAFQFQGKKIQPYTETKWKSVKKIKKEPKPYNSISSYKNFK